MSEAILRSALATIPRPRRYGRGEGQAGVSVQEVSPPGLAAIIARKDRHADLIAATREAFAVALPETAACATGAGMTFIWSGPGQWLALASTSPAHGIEAHLTHALGAFAAITDQSHARTLLRVSGPHIGDALAKGIAIDLHPRAFRTGDTAVTAVAHVGVHLWQTDDSPTYMLSVARSSSLSFWSWLEASSVEYGLDFAAD